MGEMHVVMFFYPGEIQSGMIVVPRQSIAVSAAVGIDHAGHRRAVRMTPDRATESGLGLLAKNKRGTGGSPVPSDLGQAARAPIRDRRKETLFVVARKPVTLIDRSLSARSRP